jgi:hypothetical protein
MPKHVKIKSCLAYSKTSKKQEKKLDTPQQDHLRAILLEHPNQSSHKLNAVLHFTHQHTPHIESRMVIMMRNIIEQLLSPKTGTTLSNVIPSGKRAQLNLCFPQKIMPKTMDVLPGFVQTWGTHNSKGFNHMS